MRVCALRKQFCKLFLAQSARRVLKFKEFRSPSGKKLLCNFGQVLEAPAKNKVSLLRYLVFCCVKGLCSPRHAERAGHRCRSAAGGGYSEAVMAQRSKLLAAPRQKQFWAPQEGLRSKFKSLKPLPKGTCHKSDRCLLALGHISIFYFFQRFSKSSSIFSDQFACSGTSARTAVTAAVTVSYITCVPCPSAW